MNINYLFKIKYFLFSNPRFIYSIIGVFGFNLIVGQNSNQDYNNLKIDDVVKKAMDLRHKNPDSALKLFDFSYKRFLQSKDTINATNSLLEKSYVFVNNAQYANSYDALWQALILIDKKKDNTLKPIIYNKLGRIYSYNKREDEAFKYLKKALENKKSLVANTNLNDSDLAPYYYSIAKTYRELEYKELAQTYLDSCKLFYSEENKYSENHFLEFNNKAFLEFEKAILLSLDGKNQEAITIMDSIYPWFKENQPPYLVLFYKHLGDMYFDNSDLNKSEELYRKAIKVSNDNRSHVDFTPLIYEKLSELYLQKNDYENAFNSIQIAKDLDAKFFDGRSAGNKSLLEIKDNYRIEKERQEKKIQEQYLKQLEQEDKINNLQLILLLGSLIFLLIIGFGYFKHLRTKHKTEKELIRRRKELEIHKTQELIDLKNKELAASALQLIEKDEFLKDLKSKIRVGSDKIKIHEINKVLRSISSNNNSNWDEFKLRFIDVNKEFYDKIFKKYPNLSQGDQKICALIKLNFSSKEMARLLGISVESVHTSRHRIRKKMDLPRSINLDDFINSI